MSKDISRLATNGGSIINFDRPLYRIMEGEARVDVAVEVLLTAIHGPLILEVQRMQGEDWTQVVLPKGASMKVIF